MTKALRGETNNPATHFAYSYEASRYVENAALHAAKARKPSGPRATE